jgi:hypothetical protein
LPVSIVLFIQKTFFLVRNRCFFQQGDYKVKSLMVQIKPDSNRLSYSGL